MTNHRAAKRQLKRSSKRINEIELKVDKMYEDLDKLLNELQQQVKIIQKIKKGRRKSAPKTTTIQ